MKKSPTQTSYSRGYTEGVITGSRLLHTDSRVVAISIENSWAAAFWSEGTAWCIAESSCFTDYVRKGPLILFRLLVEQRIYLLSPSHFEFRNSRNRRLCLKSFIRRFPKTEALVRLAIRDDWRASFHFDLTPDGARFDHALNLTGLGIPSLPDGLRVRDDLILRGNPIRTLPQNLFVGGDLDIRHTEITSIPGCSEIRGKVWM